MSKTANRGLTMPGKRNGMGKKKVMGKKKKPAKKPAFLRNIKKKK